eukprot:s2188_g8.t1
MPEKPLRGPGPAHSPVVPVEDVVKAPENPHHSRAGTSATTALTPIAVNLTAQTAHPCSHGSGRESVVNETVCTPPSMTKVTKEAIASTPDCSDPKTALTATPRPMSFQAMPAKPFRGPGPSPPDANLRHHDDSEKSSDSKLTSRSARPAHTITAADVPEVAKSNELDQGISLGLADDAPDGDLTLRSAPVTPPENSASVPVHEHFITIDVSDAEQTIRPPGTTPADDGASERTPHPDRPMFFHAMPVKPLRGPGPTPVPLAGITNEEQAGQRSTETIAIQPDPCTGGIHAFASPRTNPVKTSTEAHDAPSLAHRPAIMPPHEPVNEHADSEHGSFTQEMLQHIDRIPDTSHDVPADHTHLIQLIRQDDLQPSFVRIHKEATVGSITVAESKMGSMTQPICVNTCVGTRIPSATTTQPYDQIFLKEMASYGSGTTSEAINMPLELHSDQPITRIALLYRQEGFVADDEMQFYLSMLTATGQANHAPCAIIPEFYEDDELVLIMQNWFAAIMLEAEAPCTIVTALYAHYHWFPVGIKFASGKLDLYTTEGGKAWLQVLAQDMPSICTVHTCNVDRSFPNDCGFQAIAWIVGFVFDTHPTRTSHPAVSATTAAAWRGLFEHRLHVTGKAQTTIRPSARMFGGANSPDPVPQLCQLLQQHGVPEDMTIDRANMIITHIGRATVIRALRSSQQWRELKHLANHCNPKVQLILPSELQAVIAARTASQKAFGSKQTKKKQSGPPKQPLQIAAEDIGIPDGIFQDASRQGLHQLSVTQIGPEASGVVVLHAHQAIAYLKFAKPISRHGLALLVIDHQDPMLHGIGEEIRFPARCHRTAEPILMSAKLVQLGSVLVSRIHPENSLRVDQVCTTVIRVAIYKDEIDKKWDLVLEKPVKYLVSVVPILGLNADGTSPIIDVWDRQHLSTKMERVKPSTADLFTATFRLETSEFLHALKGSGSNGCYLEPRSADGRSPSPEFRVIWLNKQSKQSVLLASQATELWTCVVRAGDRFGLRVHATDAQTVHEQHKPQTPFLTSDQVLTFQAGPFPHGANRAALSKLFSSWNWQARPCQPKSRTPDGKGVIWECQAVQKPPFEVYQLEHADVLITEVQKKPHRTAPVAHTIQASAKTIAALKASENTPDEEVDTVFADDPWGKYHTPVKSAKRAVQSDHTNAADLDTIAAKVHQRLAPAWKNWQGTKTEADSEMAQDDERIQEVENRLAQLEKTVQSQHAQQGQHVKELASQIKQVQTNLDQQGQAFQNHLDSKLDQQLQQIEQLLSKRSRME